MNISGRPLRSVYKGFSGDTCRDQIAAVLCAHHSARSVQHWKDLDVWFPLAYAATS